MIIFFRVSAFKTDAKVKAPNLSVTQALQIQNRGNFWFFFLINRRIVWSHRDLVTSSFMDIRFSHWVSFQFAQDSLQGTDRAGLFIMYCPIEH